MDREVYRSYLMSTSAAWCILPLHIAPSSSSPLSISISPLQLCVFPVPQGSARVGTPVVAPKRQLASFLLLLPSLTLFPWLPPSPLTNDLKGKKRNASSFLHCRLFSLLLLLPLTQNSVCLFPKPRHCQPYDITQLPYMGNSGLP